MEVYKGMQIINLKYFSTVLMILANNKHYDNISVSQFVNFENNETLNNSDFVLGLLWCVIMLSIPAIFCLEFPFRVACCLRTLHQN